MARFEDNIPMIPDPYYWSGDVRQRELGDILGADLEEEEGFAEERYANVKRQSGVNPLEEQAKRIQDAQKSKEMQSAQEALTLWRTYSNQHSTDYMVDNHLISEEQFLLLKKYRLGPFAPGGLYANIY